MVGGFGGLSGLGAVGGGYLAAEDTQESTRKKKYEADDLASTMRGQQYFGSGIAAMFNAPVPGAQPMQPMAPGQPSMPMGGPSPAPPGGMGGGPPPGQPPGPPQQFAGGPPGMGGPPRPPMGGPPGMGGGQLSPPGQGLPGGGAPSGMMSWQQIAQQIVRANPQAAQDPIGLAKAVSMSMTLMAPQSRLEWQMVQDQIVNKERERHDRAMEGLGGARIDERREEDRSKNWRAQLSADTRTALANLSRDTKLEIEDAKQRGRLDIADLSAKARKEIAAMNIDARKELFGEAEAGRMERAGMRQETAREGMASREGIAAENRGAAADRLRERGKQRLEEIDKQNAARMERLQLSINEKDYLAQLNREQRQDIINQLEDGRMSRAQLAATIQTQGQQLRAGTAREAEAGRQDRFESGQQEKRNEFSQRQSVAERREERLSAFALTRQDQTAERLRLQRENLERQITQGNARQFAAQWRSILDAEHKRAQEIISAYSLNNNLGAPEKKKLLDEQDKNYRDQIAQMKSLVEGKQSGPTNAPQQSRPRAKNAEGKIIEWDGKNWVPADGGR